MAKTKKLTYNQILALINAPELQAAPAAPVASPTSYFPNPSVIPTGEAPSNNEGESLLNRVLGYASILGYTADNIISDVTPGSGNNPLQAAGDVAMDVAGGAANALDVPFNPLNWIPGINQGLTSLADKYNAPKTGFDLLQQWDPENKHGNKFSDALGGLALTIATDPLSYVGIGIGSNAVKDAPRIADLIKGVESADTAITPAAEIPAAFGGIKGAKTVNELVRAPVKPRETGLDLAVPGGRSQDQLQQLVDRSIAREPETVYKGTQKFNDPKTGRFYQPEIKTAEQIVKEVQADHNIFKGYDFTPKDVNSFAENFSEIQRVSKAEVTPPAAVSERVATATSAKVDDYLETAHLGKTKELNPIRQVTLAKTLIKKGMTAPKAAAVVKAAEDALIAQGIKPVAFTGEQLRLSDIIARVQPKELDNLLNEFGNKATRDPVLKAAISTQLGVRQNTLAPLLTHVSQLVKASQKESPIISENVDRVKQLKEFGLNSTRNLGNTEKEQEAVKTLLTNELDKTGFSAEKVMRTHGKSLYAATVKGDYDMDAALALNRAIEKQLGFKYGAVSKFHLTKGVYMVENKAIEGFMSHFATWWGRSDIYKYYKEVYDWGFANSRVLANLMNQMAKKWPKEDLALAMKAAQKKPGIQLEGDLKDAAAIYRDYFDTALGVSGMRKEYEAQVAAGRANILMDRLNTELGRVHVDNFRFRDDVFKDDASNIVRDFSPKGEGWLNSWEVADIPDPGRFMYNLNLAMERVMKEKAFYDELAARFGSTVKTSSHFSRVHTEYLRNHYFEPEIRKQILSMEKKLQEDMWRPNGPAMRHYAAALSAWKRGVTIYLPSHHARNLIGDTWLMWMAGHNDPSFFLKSIKVLKTQRARFKTDLDQFQRIAGGEPLPFTEGTDVILRQNGVTLNAEQLFQAMWTRGVLKSADQIEDILGTAPILGKLAPLGNRGHDAASSFSEVREWYVRGAHYISAVSKKMKSGRTDMKNIYDEAAHEVNKWHPDGSDLTNAEKNIRLVVPFYSWQRKVIPLLAQSIVQRPAKILAYPRAQLALQQMMGIQGGTIEDPFPDDQLFPDWIRSYGIGPIGDAGADGPAGFWGSLGKHLIDVNGDPYGYSIVNPGDPFEQTVTGLAGYGAPQNIAQALYGNLTPAIQVPSEVAFGQSLIGTPINQDPTNFWASNVPALAPIARIFNGVPGLGNTNDYARSGNKRIDIEALINQLTGAGLRGTAPYIKQAQIEEKNRYGN